MAVLMNTPAALVLFVCILTSVAATNPITYHIMEQLRPNTLIGQVATDSGLHEKYQQDILRTFKYSFLSQPSEDSRFFAIEENTGIVHTTAEIDREVICPQQEACFLTLDIAVSPPEYFQIITVVVEILDKNDHSPTFPETHTSRSISESMHLGATISIPAAEDTDGPSNGIQRYELAPPTGTFELKVLKSMDGSTELQLILKEALDREVLDFYQLWITAYDGGNPSKSGTIIVTVTVNDTNDNLPEFVNSTYEVRVAEDMQLQASVVQVQAFDADIGANGKIKYGFTPRTLQNYGEIFGIRESEGVIYLRHTLDYEQDSIYHLVVTARDDGPGSRYAYATAIIMVTDVNDNTPQITLNTLTADGIPQISEASPNGTFVCHMSVIDLDSGSNSDVSCRVKGNSYFQLQNLAHPSQYKLVTNSQLDREAVDQYSLTLECRDGGSKPLLTTYNMTIQVTDANDHTPVFTTTEEGAYTTSIEENNQPGAFLLKLQATDGDIGDNARIQYTIDDNNSTAAVSHLFQLSPDTGVLRAAGGLDHEHLDKIVLSVVARDRGVPSRSAVAMVTVHVLDVNDVAPSFVQKTYSLGVYENQLEGTLVGSVRAVDADSPPYDYVEYSLEADEPEILSRFEIHPQDGQIFTKIILDREDRSVYGLRVVASNMGFPVLSDVTTVVIHVADVNDNAPVMDYPNATHNTVEVSNMVPLGYVVTRVRGHDADIGQASKLKYHITDGNQDGIFAIDSQTGAITTNVRLDDIEHRLYNFTVSATDSGASPNSGSSKLFILVSKSVVYVPGYVNGGADTYTESPAEEDSDETNSIILIGVATGSILVIVALIIAIAVIKLLDRRHRGGHIYNCRTEAQKMLNTYQEVERRSNSDRNSLTASNASNDSAERGLKRSASGKLRVPEGSSQRSVVEAGTKYWVEGGEGRHRDSWPAGVSAETLQHHPVPANEDLAPHPGPSGTGQRSAMDCGAEREVVHQPRASSNQTKPWPVLSDTEIEVHRLLQFLRQEDGDSSCSDSGCGPSEEGEGVPHHHHHHHHHHQPSQTHRQNNTFTGCTTYSSDSSESESQGKPSNLKQYSLPANQRPVNQVITVAPVHFTNQGPLSMLPYANQPVVLANQKSRKEKLNQSCGCCSKGNSRHICIPMDIIPETTDTKTTSPQLSYQPLNVHSLPQRTTSLLSDSGCHSNSDSCHSNSDVQSDSDAQSSNGVPEESMLDESRDIPDDGSTTTEGSYVLHHTEVSLDMAMADFSDSVA